MGMDVYGKSPTTEVGAYFRKTIWGWHPLWDMCTDLSPGRCGEGGVRAHQRRGWPVWA